MENTPPNTQETPEQRKARLSRPVGLLDYAIVKKECPEIPDDFLLTLMFGNR